MANTLEADLAGDSRVSEADPTSTRDRILASAERMFAERGYKAASLRSITRACGVNLAAVHYHFGSKERLLEEIFDRRCGSMNRQRMALLSKCKAAPGRPPLLEQLVDAYLRPTLVWPPADYGARHFMRLRATLGYEQEELARKLVGKHFNRISRHFFRRIRELLPDISEQDLYWRLHFLLGAHYYTMANPGRIQELSNGECDPSDGEAALRQIVPFVCAGLRGPDSERLPPTMNPEPKEPNA